MADIKGNYWGYNSPFGLIFVTQMVVLPFRAFHPPSDLVENVQIWVNTPFELFSWSASGYQKCFVTFEYSTSCRQISTTGNVHVLVSVCAKWRDIPLVFLVINICRYNKQLRHQFKTTLEQPLAFRVKI